MNLNPSSVVEKRSHCKFCGAFLGLENLNEPTVICSDCGGNQRLEVTVPKPAKKLSLPATIILGFLLVSLASACYHFPVLAFIVPVLLIGCGLYIQYQSTLAKQLRNYDIEAKDQSSKTVGIKHHEQTLLGHYHKLKEQDKKLTQLSAELTGSEQVEALASGHEFLDQQCALIEFKLWDVQLWRWQNRLAGKIHLLNSGLDAASDWQGFKKSVTALDDAGRKLIAELEAIAARIQMDFETLSVKRNEIESGLKSCQELRRVAETVRTRQALGELQMVVGREGADWESMVNQTLIPTISMNNEVLRQSLEYEIERIKALQMLQKQNI